MEKDRVDARYSLLVIGGSAGSLEVILKLLATLADRLSLAIIIVMHRKSTADSSFIEFLASRTSHPLKEAEDKDPIVPGYIYIAPADYHLLVEKDKTLSLDFSEKVNYSRPSIDVTFETAAEAYGNSLACLLLSGASVDGTGGLKVVKQLGGLTMVQNPTNAEVAYMPEQAIASVEVDFIVNDSEMAQVINSL
jgi:two-component system chemotaxis response regulator CheB